MSENKNVHKAGQPGNANSGPVRIRGKGKYLLFHRHHVVKLLLWIGMECGDIHYVIECAHKRTEPVCRIA